MTIKKHYFVLHVGAGASFSCKTNLATIFTGPSAEALRNHFLDKLLTISAEHAGWNNVPIGDHIPMTYELGSKKIDDALLDANLLFFDAVTRPGPKFPIFRQTGPDLRSPGFRICLSDEGQKTDRLILSIWQATWGINLLPNGIGVDLHDVCVAIGRKPAVVVDGAGATAFDAVTMALDRFGRTFQTVNPVDGCLMHLESSAHTSIRMSDVGEAAVVTRKSLNVEQDRFMMSLVRGDQAKDCQALLFIAMENEDDCRSDRNRVGCR